MGGSGELLASEHSNLLRWLKRTYDLYSDALLKSEVGFSRTNLFEWLESSGQAFLQSVERQVPLGGTPEADAVSVDRRRFRGHQ